MDRGTGRGLKRVLVGFGLAVSLVSSSAAGPLPRDLQKAASEYDAAQVAGDRATLERLLAPDYVLVNNRGRLETKEELIADYTAPGFRLEPFTIDEPMERWWPGGAVLGGIATLKGVSAGRPYEVRLRFTDVWARRGGRWQVIHTLVAPAK